MPADTQAERELAAIDAALQGRPVEPDLKEIADLATLLRDDRMEVDPFFARELDQKAAAGFPRESRWRRRFGGNPVLVPGVAVSVLLAVAVSAALLSGGSGLGGGDQLASSSGGQVADSESAGRPDGKDSGDPAGGAGAAEKLSPDVARQSAPNADSSAGSPQSSSPLTVPPAGSGSPRSDGRQPRKVETSAALVLGVKPAGVQDVVDRVVAKTDAYRGFVMSSSTDLVDGGGGAHLDLRIPAARLKAALADLSAIADVRERREASLDITRQFVSARSRLAEARAERRGLLRELARAMSDLERVSVKLQLRRVSRRMGAAKTDLARVGNRARYSNISVSVVGDPAAGSGKEDGAGTWTPGDAARDAVRVLEVAAGVALIALAAGIPLALLGGLLLLLARVTRRRRRERLLDAI